MNLLFRFVQHRRIYFAVSGIAIAISIGAMIFSFFLSGAPFQFGVDFLGGTRFEIQFEESAGESEIRAVFRESGISNPDVTSLGNPERMDIWQIRTEFVPPEESQAILDLLVESVGPINSDGSSVQSVSPAVGAEVTRAAVVAIAVAAIIVLFYIMYTFRQVPKSYRYGASAVLAMLHDLIIIFGFIAIMGLVAGWEVNALFLTAALTVAGFSLQDTIVVFDRIRENNKKRPQEDYELLVNRSVLETIHRSLATQLAAMFVLVAILLFGGDSIKPFIAVLFVGLLSGTYSSVFNAVPTLVAWEKGEIPFLK